jgi:hypothetical protein
VKIFFRARTWRCEAAQQVAWAEPTYCHGGVRYELRAALALDEDQARGKALMVDMRVSARCWLRN